MANNNTKIFSSKGEETKDFEISLINDIVEYGIEPLIISGIDGVQIHLINKSPLIEETHIGNVHEQTSYMLIGTGSQLQDVFTNPSVDTTLTYSNNVIDMYETLGIEAVVHY